MKASHQNRPTRTSNVSVEATSLYFSTSVVHAVLAYYRRSPVCGASLSSVLLHHDSILCRHTNIVVTKSFYVSGRRQKRAGMLQKSDRARKGRFFKRAGFPVANGDAFDMVRILKSPLEKMWCYRHCRYAEARNCRVYVAVLSGRGC